MCWFVQREPYVPHEAMIERMVGSISNSSNMHEVIDENRNLYRNMVMDPMKMNQSYVGQCPIVDEEPNANAIKFFDLLKDSNEPL